MEAAKHKKDIYGEKPLAHTIAEQQAIVKAVQKNNLIWQTGSWQRSEAIFHKAAEIVRNGLIGYASNEVEVGLFSDNKCDSGKAGPRVEPRATRRRSWIMTMWLGPAAMMQYIQGRAHSARSGAGITTRAAGS